MTSPADSGEPIDALLSVLADPESGRRRLPEVLGLLDHDAERVRIGAAWAAASVAAADPEMVPYLVRRLVDRFDDDSLEVAHLYGYLAAKFPDTVAAKRQAIDAEGPDWTPPDFGDTSPRADYLEPGVGDRAVGRTRVAGEGSDGVGGPVVSDDPDGDGEAGVDEFAPEEAGEYGGSEETPQKSGGGSGRTTSEQLEAIARSSRFDRLSVLAGRHRQRYADVYRTLGVLDGDQYPVGLALFHRPDEGAEAFVDGLASWLDRWATLDHEAVVAVHDWGREPRPWAAVEYTGLALADRERLSPDEAHRNATLLADAVAHAHANGVVHAGLDPHNVVHYGNVISADERRPPLVTNVGLMHVLRRHFDPTRLLDPRYAAPEYFDRRFGRLDHATDIYHLGALLYRLFTGRPPHDGDYGAVREAVLSADPPRPGDVVAVPPAVDDVVSKAMATRKLRRYESVTRLAAELAAIEDEV